MTNEERIIQEEVNMYLQSKGLWRDPENGYLYRITSPADENGNYEIGNDEYHDQLEYFNANKGALDEVNGLVTKRFTNEGIPLPGSESVEQPVPTNDEPIRVKALEEPQPYKAPDIFNAVSDKIRSPQIKRRLGILP
jgi:hypothetical protein